MLRLRRVEEILYRKKKNMEYESCKDLIRSGAMGVMPTDTLYGVVASAMDAAAVERVYRVRGRDEGKPCIVLIGDVDALERFGIVLGGRMRSLLEGVWPGKVSVILPCPDERFAYLHRGTGTIAFRVPDRSDLRAFLTAALPLVAPSANPQGKPPAKTIAEAESYFGGAMDFYVDGGHLDGEPSTVVRFEDGALVVVRQGAVDISNRGL